MKGSPVIKAIKNFSEALKHLKYNEQFQAYL